MASYVTPKKNTQFIFYIGLIQQSDSRLLKSNPTLATGDFKVSIDGGALANLGTTPTVTPAAGQMVKITLSTSEMNGDNITVVCSDAAGAEWCDQIINIQTSARQIDDLAYPATSGRSMVVDAAGLVDANAVKVGPTGAGTAQTARDVGASVLLSAGTGTGQLDFTAGVVKANATQWLGGTIPAVNVTGVPLVDLKYTLGTISPATAGSVRADAVTGAVGSVTGAVGSVTAAVTVGTNSDKTGYTLTAGEHTSIATDAQTGLTAQGYTTTRAGYLDVLNGLVTAIWAAATRTLTAFGFSVGVTGDLSSTMKTSVETAVWDATAASHNTAGTTGAKLNSAASAGDPWATALPGAYGAGTAGAILGALNGAIAAIWAYGTRTLTAFGFTVNVNSNSDVTAIKAKTDQLTFTTPNRVDATVTSGNPNTYQQQGSGDSPYLGR